ncbi:MULE transposase domain [Sesbania bispinosa]|nr:MULE transposase domain [Sesbania bispinosa]
MEDRGNMVNEGEAGDINNLKSPEKENACSGEAVPDVYKRISELTDDEIRMLEFDSELEAYNFYCEYVKFIGFAVRKDYVYRDRNRFITMRQLVCNRQGERSEKHLNRTDRVREAKAITRTNCLARLRLYLDGDSGKWKVGMFESQHNHELTLENMVHLMPAYRGLSVVDKAQVNSFHLYGVRTCHIMGLIMGQKDGYSDLRFCKKDLYNHIDKENRAKIEDGDAFAALCHLQAKYDSNPMTFVKFTTTEDDRLENLFWVDVGSRIDYACFGDVVAFDTTYKKTSITGLCYALVSDEKTETYKWVLEAFLEAMFNKEPKAVVTDGDGAMCEAIRSVLPGSIHRLCSWHLHQNAYENVKNLKFLEDFKKLIYVNFTPEKFEQEWVHVIEKHGLSNNRWVRKVYDLKRMWATAFFRDNIFAGVRTTSICEGINSFIKRYVQSKNSLVDFLHNFERALNEYRHNKLASDFKSTYTHPVLTTALEKYEVHACNVYTRNKFFEIRKEIEKVAALNMIEKFEVGNIVTMKMNKFGSPDFVYVVLLDKSVGDISKKEVLRSGVVGVACNRLNKATHKNPHNFMKNIEAIHQLADQMETQDGVDVNIADISRVVCDPTIVKTKGAPRKRHTIRTCSKFSTRDQLQTVEEEESSVESDGESRNGPLISKKSNKRMKHNDSVKLTQESVNDRPQVNDVTNVEMRDCSRSMDHVNHMSHQM